MKNKRKTLACITPQVNSRRLIDRGAEVAGESELHILNIKEGNCVFEDPGHLLEELFDYGKSKGGIVHFISGDDFFVSLKVFALNYDFTDIILGESPVTPEEELRDIILDILPNLNVHILLRPEGAWN